MTFITATGSIKCHSKLLSILSSFFKNKIDGNPDSVKDSSARGSPDSVKDSSARTSTGSQSSSTNMDKSSG